MVDNSFQSEEPIHYPGLRSVKKSTQYSSSLPISMPAGKISPPMDDQEVTSIIELLINYNYCKLQSRVISIESCVQFLPYDFRKLTVV